VLLEVYTQGIAEVIGEVYTQGSAEVIGAVFPFDATKTFRGSSSNCS
jgi:hypothetical protein